MNEQLDPVLSRLLQACHRLYDERLVSLAVFGSVGRGTARPDSDIDILAEFVVSMAEMIIQI